MNHPHRCKFWLSTKNFHRVGALGSGLLLLAGCALTPQQVKFQPTVARSAPAAAAAVAGKEIALVTADERLSSAIGNRGLGPGGMSAEITTSDDIAKIVNDQVSTAMTNHGFTVKNGPQKGLPELRIEVRNLAYQVSPGIITGHLRAEAVLKGACTVAGERRYEHLYRGESTEEVFVVQFAESNAKHLNTALSSALSGIVTDQKLATCLTE